LIGVGCVDNARIIKIMTRLGSLADL